MIGIKSIASYVPEGVVDNVEQAARFDKSADFIENKVGALRLPRKAADEETSDLAVQAVENLLARNPQLSREQIDAIVVVTQNGDGAGLPHTAAIVQAKLGLETRVAAFDLSLGCSGYVYGLYMLAGFMRQVGLHNGVLVTADPYSKIIDDNDAVTAMLFGDAATATWLAEGAAWQLGAMSFGTDGGGRESLRIENDVLHMDGRAVFNFAATRIPAEIKALLTQAGWQADDVDAYCLHQGSYAIIDTISKRFPEVSDRFVKDIQQVGNTVSSSIPLLLEHRLDQAGWQKVLVSGFGVGLSWATALLTKKGDK
ncbi:ketoacyl-ACP synthase III [Pseudomonas guariconensis]|uniref:ketoacyl-ACP synthase III n=1 Tax=Pseudomonas guariconensis TaxID=1288410 RepID=UPI0018AC458D|nr:ketoacyl-ACP synthase III [Pseudomonas guariconensis]MBF8731399.1 ketoacyl-ACP synthase III [Pseudomonas guariconensis]